MLRDIESFSRKLHKLLNPKNDVNPVQYMLLIGVAICIIFLYFLKCRMAGGEFPPPHSVAEQRPDRHGQVHVAAAEPARA